LRHICVYAASSAAVDEEYKAAARRLGALIGRRGDTLVYGAGKIGLMGECARAVHENGGRVVGVIPDRLVDLELEYREADELIVTETMHDRKVVMAARADAFLALPGSFGTLEEMMEALTLKQLGYHNKPCAFINTRNFYDWLFAFFGTLVCESFLKEASLDMFAVCATPEAAFEYLDGYEPDSLPQKWF
jgi:cytokinin riboside 5'-monophosphate phosphoribohydrolase